MKSRRISILLLSVAVNMYQAGKKRQRTGAVHNAAARFKGPLPIPQVVDCACPLALFWDMQLTPATKTEMRT
jgi:hypothetical protein